MDTLRICSQCHAPLPPDSEGLCPQCLLRQAMTSQTLPHLSSAGDGPSAGLHSGTVAHSGPRVGEIYGAYRIVRLLGKGGMGEVYEAHHLESGRRVALKVMAHHLASPEEHKRFLREGRLAASVSHPNTVYIYGSEEIAGRPVIAMELVGAGTLKDRVKAQGPLPSPQAVDVILQIIAGLDAAKRGGVLHRDIKPANCFIDRDGTVKVGDFGLSISTIARGESFLTAPGSVLGTPAFASPEQLRGQDLDVRSDIYAVGATLYFLVTGHAPLESQDLVKLIAEVLDRTPQPPLSHRSDLPPGLSRVIMRCLEKDGRKRYADYDQLREALIPFGSNAATPAMVGVRCAAGFIDYLLAFIPEWVCVIYSGTDTFTNVLQTGSPGALGYWAAAYMFTLLYFSVPEGLYGASVGKALCGLRVVQATGHAPGIPRAFWRTFVFNTIPWIPYFVRMLTMSTEQARVLVAGGDSTLTDTISFALIFVLFITMRRRNGYAALHDLASGTRVVARPKTERRPALPSVVSPSNPNGHTATSESVPAHVGPYQVTGVALRWNTRQLLEGFDPVLQRRVWIEIVPSGTEPVSARRRDLSRPGRLRWLNGSRGNTNWDAYEAIPGQALLSLPRKPWAAVRFWMLDLAQELYAGTRHQSPIDTLQLNRVWISNNGHALLLDFPAPGAYTRTGDDFPVAPADIDPVSMQEFLNRVAAASLSQTGPPPPLHVHSFLDRLGARKFEAAEILVANLQSLAGKLAFVSRRRRAAILAAGVFVLAFLTAFGVAFDTIAQRRWDTYWSQKYPSRGPFREILQTYQVVHDADDNPAQSVNQTNLTTLFEIVLAGRFRDIIDDPTFWAQPEARAAFDNDQRRLARSAAKKHRSADSELLQTAEPLVLASVNDVRSDRRWYLWEILCIFWLLTAFAGTIAIMSALFFRCNPVLRMLGLVVVRPDGTLPGRPRLVFRSLIAWAPSILAVILIGQVYWTDMGSAAGSRMPAPVSFSSPGLLIAIGAILLLYVVGWVWSIWKPARGWPDIAARTYIVPR